MKLKFLPQNILVDTVSSKSVMDIAREQKLPVSSSCNGMCVCAECRVYVVEGENNVLPPTEKEVELIGGGYFVDRRRLACQLFCFGNVTVDLSEQVERTSKKKGVTKPFLKKIRKEDVNEISSVGGIFVEKDKDMTGLYEEKEENSYSELEDTFYNKIPRRSRVQRKNLQPKKTYHSKRRNRGRNKKSKDR